MTRRPILGALLILAGLAGIAYAVLVWKEAEPTSFGPDMAMIPAALVMVLGINFIAARPRSKPD